MIQDLQDVHLSTDEQTQLLEKAAGRYLRKLLVHPEESGEIQRNRDPEEPEATKTSVTDESDTSKPLRKESGNHEERKTTDYRKAPNKERGNMEGTG